MAVKTLRATRSLEQVIVVWYLYRPGRPTAGRRTRSAVLDAAVWLASERGLDGLTLSQLAGHLGVSKPELLAQWASKEELLLASLRRPPAVDRPRAPAGVLVEPNRSLAACGSGSDLLIQARSGRSGVL
ncbi:MAG TPA: helix-turn-helix domain-containing protein [Pilimelia sp.]|nr:helix-turn-helix domain-containing protein [Pilimelia sp.]